MKIWLLIPLCLLPCGAAMADPVDPNPNGIGIYADAGGLVNEVDVEVGEAMEVYVVVTRATGTRALAGVEFTLVIPENVVIWGWNTPLYGTFAATDPPDFMAVWQPVDYELANHVLTLIIVPLDSEPAVFRLLALQHPSGGEAPRYLDMQYGENTGDELVDLTPYPGGQENACFVINGEIVPDEAASWSDLKALYR